MVIEYRKRGFIAPIIFLILGIIFVLYGSMNYSPQQAATQEYYLPSYFLFFGWTLILIGFLAMFLLIARLIIFHRYAIKLIEEKEEEKE